MSKTKWTKESIAQFLKESIERFVKLLQVLGASVAFFAMSVCFGLGFVRISNALIQGIRPPFFSPQAHADNSLVSTILDAVELFFLAPLPLLVFYSLIKFIRAVMAGAETNVRAGGELLVEVKSLIMSLMIAVVATELIHGITAGLNLSPLRVFAMVAAIISLSFYFWVFTRFKNH